jgi:hypothetical protein
MSSNRKRSLHEFDDEGYELDNTPPDEEEIKTLPVKNSSPKGLKKLEYIRVPDLEFVSYEAALAFCKQNRLGYLYDKF